MQRKFDIEFYYQITWKSFPLRIPFLHPLLKLLPMYYTSFPCFQQFHLWIRSSREIIMKTNFVFTFWVLKYGLYYIVALFSFAGIYMLVSVVVLINLLIAMMSDTYQRIQAQSDIEWKYGLAKLIRNMHRTTTTPSPINLITTWLMVFLRFCKQKGTLHRQFFFSYAK